MKYATGLRLFLAFWLAIFFSDGVALGQDQFIATLEKLPEKTLPAKNLSMSEPAHIASAKSYALLQPKLIQAQVQKSWTVPEARAVGFAQARPWVDLSAYPAKDPYYSVHLLARTKGQTQIGSRLITYFDNGHYSISEMNGDRGFYYTPQGNLYAVDFDASEAYPIKSYKHHYPSGKLVNVSLTVKPGEDFVFNAQGDLLTHWMGTQCFDALGQLISSRSSMTFETASKQD